MAETWVGLLDCNNFFVSCERLFRPDLKNQPVLVLSSNDGCVVARSQEVKDIGIPMGVPYFQIKDIIKDNAVVLFSSHFTLYRDISRRVFEVMRTELGIVEQYSIDEAFFALQGSRSEVKQSARVIKDKVEQLVGIPVSVGLASSKTRAKYASTVAKRTGEVCIIDDAAWNIAAPTLLMEQVWGVGAQSTKLFKSYNIVTVADFISVGYERAEAIGGVAGARLYRELQGIPLPLTARSVGEQKSILHSRSFQAATTEKTVVHDAVAYHVREAAENLRDIRQKTAYLQVSIQPSRHGDFFLHGGRADTYFPVPTSDTFVLLARAYELVEQLFKPGVPYKKAGVLLHTFTPENLEQGTLFIDQKTVRTADLMPVIDSINQKLGRGSVLVGTRLQTKKWDTSHQAVSPNYTTDWEQLVTVKA